MNKIIFSVLFLIGVLCSPLKSHGTVKTSQPDKDTPVTIIEGTTTIIPDSSAITLFKYYGNVGLSVATDTVINGKFRLEYQMEDGDAEKMTINCFSPKISGSGRTVYLIPGAHIKVDASTPNSERWDVTSDIDIKEQKEYDKILFSCSDIFNAMDKIRSENSKRLSDPDLTAEQKKQIRTEMNETISGLRDSINHRKYLMMLQMEHTPVWFENFVDLCHRSSISGDSILASKLIAMYEALEKSEKESAEGVKIAGFLYPESKINIGDKIPYMEFVDFNGNTRNLGEFAGKWILLDIWSGGCGPCHMSVPELKAFAEKHKGEVEVVSISIDTDDFWRISTKNLNIEGNNWNDRKGESGAYSRFNTKGLPTFIAINPEGIYTTSKLGYTKGTFELMFRRLLNPKPAMSRETKATGIKVNYPDCMDNNTHDILEIDSIELSDDRTAIHFHMYYMPNWWIKISPDSYLELPDGSKLNILEAQGIALGEEFRANADGENTFTLVFPAIDKNTPSINFMETPRWNIKDIRLVP